MSSEQIPLKQRALVFQGGGALGAYEAGVFQTLYKKFFEKDGLKAEKNLFDIVAGSSIGAINSTVLINHFLNHGKSWKGSSEVLENFWKDLTSYTLVDNKNPLFQLWWNSFWKYWHSINPKVFASPEAARRYWSWNQLANLPWGSTHNLSVTIPEFDFKYFDFNPAVSGWLGYDFYPLRKILEDSIYFPIKTNFENREPRLLMVSVDVQDCTSAVTFDSYPKGNDMSGNNIWYSEYSGSIEDDDESSGQKSPHHVNYDGIGIDQVLTSSLFPYSLNHSEMNDEQTHTKRTFWDGNFISSTPLREVLQYHRDFWLSYFKQKNIDYDDGTLEKEGKQKVPELEVFIVNLYPSIEDNIPEDLDSIRDREIDIKFHDRTKYDEQIAHVVTDYINLIRKIRKIAMNNAKDKQSLRAEFDSLLKDDGPLSRGRGGKIRKYQSLLEARFDAKVHRIDRRNDGSTIFGKHADFSETTIEELIKAGRDDTDKQISF